MHIICNINEIVIVLFIHFSITAAVHQTRLTAQAIRIQLPGFLSVQG